MSFVSFSNAGARRSAISLTPLIDVVFILLLFFMLSSTFSAVKGLRLQAVTQGGEVSLQQPDPVFLKVLNAQDWLVDGEAVSSEASAILVERVLTTGAVVLVQADPSASVQDVVTVLTLLAGQGLADVKLLPSQGD
jgi:biopolymer transport protein ExbD